MSFLDIKKIIRIVTVLRASSSFEPFGLGGPGEEDAAASLGARCLVFLHRRTVSPPSFAAHLLDPPLQGRRLPRHRHPTPSFLTPSTSAESADKVTQTPP